MLISLDQLRTHWAALQASGALDALGEAMIPRADALMAAYCGYPLPASGGRTLTVASYVLHLDGPSAEDPRILSVGVRPLVTVDELNVDSAWDFDVDTAVDLDDVRTIDAHGEVLALSGLGSWLSMPRAIRVTCTAGFATAPPDLVVACATTVRHLVDRGSAGEDYLSASSSRQSTTRADATHLLPATVRAVLDQSYTLWGSRVG